MRHHYIIFVVATLILGCAVKTHFFEPIEDIWAHLTAKQRSEFQEMGFNWIKTARAVGAGKRLLLACDSNINHVATFLDDGQKMLIAEDQRGLGEINWLEAAWKLDGSDLEAVLYKPKNSNCPILSVKIGKVYCVDFNLDFVWDLKRVGDEVYLLINNQWIRRERQTACGDVVNIDGREYIAIFETNKFVLNKISNPRN